MMAGFHHFGRKNGFYTCMLFGIADNSTTIIIGNVYRSPIADIYYDLSNILKMRNANLH